MPGLLPMLWRRAEERYTFARKIAVHEEIPAFFAPDVADSRPFYPPDLTEQKLPEPRPSKVVVVSLMGVEKGA